ncbi:hypothetical protein V8E36_009728 [Tilletia maclaganii]
MSRTAIKPQISKLQNFNGSNASIPLLVALDRRVYDVSSKREVYGPGGGYATFAGRDSTRNFALFSIEPESDGSCIDDLGEEELNTLAKWRRWFDDNYPLVGWNFRPSWIVKLTVQGLLFFTLHLPRRNASPAVIVEELCESDSSQETAVRRGFALPPPASPPPPSTGPRHKLDVRNAIMPSSDL